MTIELLHDCATLATVGADALGIDDPTALALTPRGAAYTDGYAAVIVGRSHDDLAALIRLCSAGDWPVESVQVHDYSGGQPLSCCFFHVVTLTLPISN